MIATVALGSVIVDCGARTWLDEALLDGADGGAPPDSGGVDARRPVRDASSDRGMLDASPADDASPDGDAATCNLCGPGETRCQPEGISACVVRRTGCYVWAQPILCAAGFACVDADAGPSCAPIATPRPVAPLSTSTVTSHEPTFHWALAGDDDGAQVEVFRDRACTDPVTTFGASGTSAVTDVDFAPGVYFWRVRGSGGISVGDDTSAVWEFRVGAGNAPVDTSFGTMLDVNGDGYADVIVPDEDTNARGADLRVYDGASQGFPATPVTVAAPVPAGSGASFGVSPFGGTTVASAGDVNGDGFDDVVVGAPGCCGVSGGTVYVFLGGASGLSASPTAIGGVPYFGDSVASAGDVDGDGYADIVVGAGSAAYAQIFFGGPTGITTRSRGIADGAPALSVAGVGDVDGDGYGDVAIGNYAGAMDVGGATVFRGGPSAMSITLLNPGTVDSFLGYAMAGAGDANGDGCADIALGAPGATPEALLYFGGPQGPIMAPITLQGQGPTPSAPGFPATAFGAATAFVGDVDGDGLADLAVANVFEGAVYVYLRSAIGPNASSPVRLGPPGVGAPSTFGQSILPLGDADGDGYDDFAVTSAADTVVFFGAPGGPSVARMQVLSP